MYDENPRYSIVFTKKQSERYSELNSKNVEDLTESEKIELINLFEYADKMTEKEFREILNLE